MNVIFHLYSLLSSVIEWQLDVPWIFLCILEMLAVERYGKLYQKVSYVHVHYLTCFILVTRSFIRLVLREHVQLQ